MNKLKMHTPILLEKNVAKIGKLFPSCVTEVEDESGQLKEVIDFDQLRQELYGAVVEGSRERYLLNWPGKRDATLAANCSITKTLRPYRDESVSFATTKHLFIEGDNLEALKLLQETYLNSVQMIYLDPPYNTGNDFVYRDSYGVSSGEYLHATGQRNEDGVALVASKETGGRRHSQWLSMIYPRLKLARSLMKDGALLVASIDDHEVNNLITLGNELFGTENFLGLIPVINNMKGRNSMGFHSQIHEYMVAFQKGRFVSNGLRMSEEKKMEFDQEDVNGRRFKWDDLRKRGGEDLRTDREDMHFPLFVDPESLRVSLQRSESHSVEVKPIKGDGVEGRWRWGKKKVTEEIDELLGRKNRRGEIGGINFRVYLDSEDGEKRVSPKSVWTGPEFSTDNATRNLNELMPGIVAKELAPKPVGQLCQLIELSMGEEDIVIDLFAGTGTAAEAVLTCNARDGGKRRCISIQIPELCREGTGASQMGFKTISEICCERIRRAGASIKDETGLHGADVDVGFRVLKVDSSNMKDVYYSPDGVNQGDLLDQIENIKEDRTPEDLLFQVLLDWGVDLSLPIESEKIEDKTVFFVDENALAACFDEDISEELVTQIAGRKPLRAVFRDAGFKSDSVKINVEQIFKQYSPTTEVKAI